MDFTISKEHQELRDRLGKFIQEELIPLEKQEKVDPDAGVSQELRRRVRTRSNELGLFALGLPKEHGGGGLGPLGMTVLREEVARSDSALALVAR